MTQRPHPRPDTNDALTTAWGNAARDLIATGENPWAVGNAMISGGAAVIMGHCGPYEAAGWLRMLSDRLLQDAAIAEAATLTEKEKH